jgi:hypothetical protein
MKTKTKFLVDFSDGLRINPPEKGYQAHYTTKRLDAKNPFRFDPSIPGFDPSIPGFDPSILGFDPSIPGFDPNILGFNPSISGSDLISASRGSIQASSDTEESEGRQMK